MEAQIKKELHITLSEGEVTELLDFLFSTKYLNLDKREWDSVFLADFLRNMEKFLK